MNTDKLFLSCDGALYDARDLARVVRPLYARHVGAISNTIEMRASIRAGKYAFPGYDAFLACDHCARVIVEASEDIADDSN